MWKEAIENYKLALEINPTDTSTHDLLNDATKVLADSSEWMEKEGFTDSLEARE